MSLPFSTSRTQICLGRRRWYPAIVSIALSNHFAVEDPGDQQVEDTLNANWRFLMPTTASTLTMSSLSSTLRWRFKEGPSTSSTLWCRPTNVLNECEDSFLELGALNSRAPSSSRSYHCLRLTYLSYDSPFASPGILDLMELLASIKYLKAGISEFKIPHVHLKHRSNVGSLHTRRLSFIQSLIIPMQGDVAELAGLVTGACRYGVTITLKIGTIGDLMQPDFLRHDDSQ
ncbi:uncharacterized protein BT62DRAFT_1078083 [Guyanagaster necrorhizus]|uniref:Uncharacterized protein n=1 Tax=Guyanagaster necrorhizus TaxID=856835 RepID=A0A9P7VNP6_9AGAR|nr:uncharacterized protein BT62DRAFT_1078083 [Guyanagaster necrorhizus MCA 3950]KAG7443888.1 hypothetical protein BT62DRAFT_1078083 [Guyanagaster necrorhizus MCA 3950]